MPMLIILQVLSGKQPWSEFREDAAVVLRLAKGQKPSRPVSRPMDDVHWNWIQDCWSAIEERPTAEVIISTIQQFLSYCQQPPPTFLPQAAQHPYASYSTANAQREGVGIGGGTSGYPTGANLNVPTLFNPDLPNGATSSAYYPKVSHIHADTINHNNVIAPGWTLMLDRDDGMQNWGGRQAGKPSAAQSYPQPEYLQQQVEPGGPGGWSGDSSSSAVNHRDKVPSTSVQVWKTTRDTIDEQDALTPVLDRDDSTRQWERKHAGNQPAAQSYPQLDYLQQQAELAATGAPASSQPMQHSSSYSPQSTRYNNDSHVRYQSYHLDHAKSSGSHNAHRTVHSGSGISYGRRIGQSPHYRSTVLFEPGHPSSPQRAWMQQFIQLFINNMGAQCLFLSYEDTYDKFQCQTLTPLMSNCIAALGAR